MSQKCYYPIKPINKRSKECSGLRPLQERKDKYMKKSVVTSIVLSVVLVVLIASLALFAFRKSPADNTFIKWSETITVTNRTLSSESSSVEFTVEEEGEYRLYISLIPEGYDKDSILNVKTPDLGFVTASVITNAAGEIIYTNVSGAVFLDTVIILEPGNYELTHHYLADEEEFYDFATVNICSQKAAEELKELFDFPAFAENTETKFNYEFSYEKADALSKFTTVYVIWGIVIGLVAAALLMVLLTTNGSRPEYDERQVMEQGKGFKLGFFTMLILTGIMAAIDLNGSHPAGSFGIYYVMGLFVALSVYLVYAIWKESYFAINQKTSTALICFALIAFANLVLSIFSIVQGRVFVDGRLTFRVLNILCTLLFVVVFITTWIRKSVNEKIASSEDEEEDE